MKLNKKGYMLVEIIVAFALAFSIAMYLLNLTLKFKDTNEDIYYSAKYLKDKNLITRNIMSDLEKNIVDVSSINKSAKELTFDVYILKENGDSTRETRKLKISGNTIEYGKFNTNFVKGDRSYYKKELEQSLIIGDMSDEFCSLENNYFCFQIPISSMYDDKNYGITILSNNVEIIT